MIQTRTLQRSREGSWLIIGGTVAIALIFLVGVGAWYQFFRDDAPPPVSLGGAVSSLSNATPTATDATPTSAANTPAAVATTAPDGGSSSTAAPDPATPEATAAASGSAAGLDGDWAVDPAQDSFVGYRVGEELVSVGTAEAVGRTGDVTGTVTISGTSATAATFEADLTTLESDKSMRDGQLRTQAIETGTYPTATFTLTQPIDFGEALSQGTAADVVAHGDLTLHGVTKTVDIPLQVQYTNGVLVVVGSLDINFADYNIEQPTSMRVVSVSDHGTLELQLFLSPA